MNNDVFDRLYALFEGLGLKLQDGSLEMAELKAYCAALSLAGENGDKRLQNIFIETADGEGLSSFLGMTGGAFAKTDDETKSAVILACADGDRFITASDFENAVSSLAPGAQYCVSGTDFVLSLGGAELRRDTLQKLSEFFKGYAPACYRFTLGGLGKTWEELENPELRWHEINSLSLPFSAWEAL